MNEEEFIKQNTLVETKDGMRVLDPHSYALGSDKPDKKDIYCGIAQFVAPENKSITIGAYFLTPDGANKFLTIPDLESSAHPQTAQAKAELEKAATEIKADREKLSHYPNTQQEGEKCYAPSTSQYFPPGLTRKSNGIV